MKKFDAYCFVLNLVLLIIGMSLITLGVLGTMNLISVGILGSMLMLTFGSGSIIIAFVLIVSMYCRENRHQINQ